MMPGPVHTPAAKTTDEEYPPKEDWKLQNLPAIAKQPENRKQGGGALL